jgi:hypothetical protein
MLTGSKVPIKMPRRIVEPAGVHAVLVAYIAREPTERGCRQSLGLRQVATCRRYSINSGSLRYRVTYAIRWKHDVNVLKKFSTQQIKVEHMLVIISQSADTEICFVSVNTE